MDNIARKNLIFFDTLSERNLLLLKTIQFYGLDYIAVALKEEFCFSDNALSLYEAYIMANETKTLDKKDIYFWQIAVDKVMDFRLEGSYGEIKDMEKLRAVVWFKDHNRRTVSKVEWYSENGIVYKEDYYGHYGFVYCSVWKDGTGEIVSKEYYSSNHEILLHVNCSNQVTTLYSAGKTIGIIGSEEELIRALFCQLVGASDAVILTSAQQTEWNLESKEYGEKNKVIMLQEENEVRLCRELISEYSVSCPMFILKNYATRMIELDSANEFWSYYLGEYEVKNHKDKNALVITALDDLPGIEQMIERLPKITFHIAAKSIVSQKLKDLLVNSNACVYECVSDKKLNELFELCDFYLDINHGREMLDAVVVAFCNHMLILGYQKLLHNKQYMLDEMIFEYEELDRMIDTIGKLAKDKELYKKSLMNQYENVKGNNVIPGR